jgi:trimethylamine--corrinoid protein Co-methyltransferase
MLKNGPHIRMFSEEQLDRIEETAFRLLEEVGISLQHARATEMLRGLGCRVAGERVLIPREVVAKSLSVLNRDSVARSRDGSREAVLGLGRFLTHNGGGDPFVLDIQTGKRRSATLQDLADATRVLDALPNVDVITPLLGPQDVPPGLMIIAAFETMMRNTVKPITAAAAENPADVRYMVELAAACCGGMEAFRRCPTISVSVSPVSPLTFGDKVAGAILAVVESGAPFHSLPSPSMGATGPITMAGILAQQHAEVLASFVLVAAACPGASVTYCSRISPIDLRTAISTWGGPEVGLSGAAATQLAHRSGFKLDCYGLSTDSNRFDPQFAYEKFANALMPALAGADILSGIGMMGNGLMASVQGAVVDDEMVGLMRHLLRGYEVTEETLAFDVMKEVILRDGMFLAEEHTVKNMREGALYMPLSSDRAVAGDEDSNGGVAARARTRALEILSTHSAEPLPDQVDRELKQIMERARRELTDE